MGVLTIAFERNLLSEDILYFILPLDFVIRAIGSSANMVETIKYNTNIYKLFFTLVGFFLMLFPLGLILIQVHIRHRYVFLGY